MGPLIHFGAVTSTFLESALLNLEIFEAIKFVERIPNVTENAQIDKSIYFLWAKFMNLSFNKFFIDIPEMNEIIIPLAIVSAIARHIRIVTTYLRNNEFFVHF